MLATALRSDTDKFCPEKTKKPKKPQCFAKIIAFYYIFVVFVGFETRFLAPKNRKSQHNLLKPIVFIAFVHPRMCVRLEYQSILRRASTYARFCKNTIKTIGVSKMFWLFWLSRLEFLLLCWGRAVTCDNLPSFSPCPRIHPTCLRPSIEALK